MVMYGSGTGATLPPQWILAQVHAEEAVTALHLINNIFLATLNVVELYRQFMVLTHPAHDVNVGKGVRSLVHEPNPHVHSLS